MKIKQTMQSMRWLLGFLPGLIAIYVGGCNVAQERARSGYGQEFQDSYRDPQALGAFDPAQSNAPSRNGGNASDWNLAKHARGAPVENPGRPGRHPSAIPGISDIPEIPDEPTVLSE
ncbi:MAG: hypothetical protein ACRESZ_09540 [Methylococcales bacterium]